MELLTLLDRYAAVAVGAAVVAVAVVVVAVVVAAEGFEVC